MKVKEKETTLVTTSRLNIKNGIEDVIKALPLLPGSRPRRTPPGLGLDGLPRRDLRGLLRLLGPGRAARADAPLPLNQAMFP